MKCPVRKSSELTTTELESGLPAFKCDQCGGKWIGGKQYWKWLEGPPNLPELEIADTGLTLAEPGKPINCPECRFRMVKYLAGHGFSFTLDFC